MSQFISFAIAALLISPAFADHNSRLEAEALIGHMITSEGVHIQVPSGGCTDKKDFQVLQNKIDGRKVLTFVRVGADSCLAQRPYGKVLTFSFEELGLQQEDLIQVGNEDSAVFVIKPI